MHHLTTLNLPTPSSKEAERQWLAAKLAEAGVGQVPVTPIEPRPLVRAQWTADAMTIISQAERAEKAQRPARKPTGRPTGTIADDRPLVERAKAMAKLGLSRYRAARALHIGCDRLDRMCREHDFTFPKSAKAA